MARMAPLYCMIPEIGTGINPQGRTTCQRTNFGNIWETYASAR
ncbi:hypothetical protein SAMCCGM7_pC1453 (plasmid) [Sinorhizobium americanum CCGM7]|nr:hypothetical protein SAMCCGM7_pC1453 [Sinorhizobium americanum CCGM7]